MSQQEGDLGRKGDAEPFVKAKNSVLGTRAGAPEHAESLSKEAAVKTDSGDLVSHTRIFARGIKTVGTAGWEKPLTLPRMSRPRLDCTHCHTKYYLKEEHNTTENNQIRTKPKLKLLF